MGSINEVVCIAVGGIPIFVPDALRAIWHRPMKRERNKRVNDSANLHPILVKTHN